MTHDDLVRKIGPEMAALVRLPELDEAMKGATDQRHPCVVTQSDVAVARALLMTIARHPIGRGTSLERMAEEALACLIGYVEPPCER